MGAVVNQAAALMTMARYVARRKIKEHLQRNGIRPSTIEPWELDKLIDAFLKLHKAELLEEPKARLSR